MKRILISILMVLLMAFPAFAVTNTFQSGGVNLNWSTVGNWDQGHVPLAGEDVVIPNLVAVMDVTRIPATAGKIASLTFTTGGQITIANAIGDASINVTGDITAGTKNTGAILISGSSANTITIDAANVVAGSGTSAYGISGTNTAGTIAIVGHVKGGSANSCTGVYITGAGGTLTISNGVEGGSAGSSAYGINITANNVTTTISGDLTGGAGLTAAALNIGAGTPGTTTISSTSNIIDGAGSPALSGKRPVWNPAATVYHQMYTNGGATNWYYDLPAASNVLPADTVAGVTGTAAAGGGAYAY